MKKSMAVVCLALFASGALAQDQAGGAATGAGGATATATGTTAGMAAFATLVVVTVIGAVSTANSSTNHE